MNEVCVIIDVEIEKRIDVENIVAISTEVMVIQIVATSAAIGLIASPCTELSG